MTRLREVQMPRLRRFRDTLTGRFTTAEDADARPAVTVGEHRAQTGGWKVLSGSDNHVLLLWNVRRTNGVAARRFLVELPDDDGDPTVRSLP